MIRILLVRHLRHHWRLLAALGLGLSAVEILLVWVASQLEVGGGIRLLIERFMPPTIRAAFGGQLEMFSFAGAVAFGFQHPLILVATIAFVTVAATLPAAERESGFLDLILARPLPRWRYLLAVILLVVLGALLLPALLLAAAAVGLGLVEVADELPWVRYLPAATGLASLLLAIGGYTLWIATFAVRRGVAVARAVGLTLIFYWLDFIAELWKPLKTLDWLNPFTYFDPIPAAVMQRTPVEHPLVLLTVFAVGVAAARWQFERRDL